jgi:hypothetical protein
MSVSRPHAAAHVAHHDAPLIAERAATRGRSATEGGVEHAGLKGALPVRAPGRRTGSGGGNLDPLAATRPTEAHWRTHPASSRSDRHTQRLR